MTDGTVTFYINDTLSKHALGDIVYKPLEKLTEHEYLLPLDGQKIDGTTYKRLTDYLGTTALPNLNGRYLRADTTPNMMVAEGLPDISGTFELRGGFNDDPCLYGDGAFSASVATWSGEHGDFDSVIASNPKTQKLSFKASGSNSIYGKSSTVTPLTYTVRAYICYA